MKLPKLIVIAVGILSVTVRGEEVNRDAAVTAFKGSVSVMQPGSSVAQTVTVGAHVAVGAQITTTANSTATLRFFDGTVVIVQPNSKMTVDTNSLTTVDGKVTNENTLLNLQSGMLLASIDPARHDITKFKVRTPRGVASARGTVFAVRVTQNQENADVTTMNGTVTFVTDQGEFTVSFGQVGSTSGVMSVSDAVKANPELAGEIISAVATVAAAAGDGSLSNTDTSPNLVNTVLAAVVEVAAQAAPAQAAEIVSTAISAAGLSGSAAQSVAQAAIQGASSVDSTQTDAITEAVDNVLTENGDTPTGDEGGEVLPQLDPTQTVVSPSGN